MTRARTCSWVVRATCWGSPLLGLSVAGALRRGPGHPQFLHEDHRSHNRRSVAFSRLPCPTSHPARPRPGSATPAAQGLFEIAFSTAVAQPGNRRSHTSLARLAFVCGEHHCTPSPEHACLIDCTLPAATNHVKDGYFYNLTAGDRPTMPRTTYVVAAAAAQIHKTGDHNFCAVEDRRIRYDKPSTNTPVAELTWSACRALPILP